MKSIRFMNNMNEAWKCPVCDTLNNGQRCIVCGNLKPDNKTVEENADKLNQNAAKNLESHRAEAENSETNTADTKYKPEQKEKSKKGLVIGLSVGGGILLISIITALIVAFLPAKDTPKKETKSVSHEADEDKDKEADPKEEKIVEYLSDPFFNTEFNVSVSENDLIRYPDYKTHTVGKLTYVCPEGFSQTGENRFMSNDSTAFLTYKISENSEKLSAKEVIDAKKKAFGGSVVFENVTENRARFKAERNGFVYYIDCCTGSETAEMIFCYPKRYAPIYGSYLDDLTSGFKADVKPLPDFEVVEDDENMGETENLNEYGGE